MIIKAESPIIVKIIYYGFIMGSQYKNSRDASRVVLMSDTDRVRDSPETMRQWPNAGTMLGHRRRRWTNIVPALSERLCFLGEVLTLVMSLCSEILTL